MLVPSDFETYRAYSHALMDILRSFSPVLQQMSVDEAYLDVTEQVHAIAERLSNFPSQESIYKTSALHLADEIRRTVCKKLGFTVNVGISTNKLLAKMASDFQKPDKTHTLYPKEVPDKMWPLPIGDLYGCGKATAKRLQTLGFKTIGDVAGADLSILKSVLGEKAGLYIYNSANGKGKSIVHTEREQAKSISNETTLRTDINHSNYHDDALPVIHRLAEKVAGRMQKAGFVGETVTFQVKTSDFQRFTRQTSLPEASDRADVIEQAALRLAERLLLSPDGLFPAGGAIRLIGIGVSKLSTKENLQMSLTAWMEQKSDIEEEAFERRAREKHLQELNEEKKKRQQRLDQVVRDLEKRFGTGAVRKGSD